MLQKIQKAKQGWNDSENRKKEAEKEQAKEMAINGGF